MAKRDRTRAKRGETKNTTSLTPDTLQEEEVCNAVLSYCRENLIEKNEPIFCIIYNC